MALPGIYLRLTTSYIPLWLPSLLLLFGCVFNATLPAQDVGASISAQHFGGQLLEFFSKIHQVHAAFLKQVMPLIHGEHVRLVMLTPDACCATYVNESALR
jgi:hypothetical protein